MKNARLIVAGRREVEFVWTKIEENKWIERFYKLQECGWSLIHKVEFLTEEAVEGFATQLEECGFTMTVA